MAPGKTLLSSPVPPGLLRAPLCLRGLCVKNLLLPWKFQLRSRTQSAGELNPIKLNQTKKVPSALIDEIARIFGSRRSTVRSPPLPFAICHVSQGSGRFPARSTAFDEGGVANEDQLSTPQHDCTTLHQVALLCTN